MSIGAGRHNATTLRAAVALHKQTGNKSIKKTRSKAMSPNPVMVAVKAGGRPYPWEILTLLRYVLENNCNKIYHEFTFVVWGSYPKMQKGGEFAKTHRPN